jgi:hypothetical protein
MPNNNFADISSDALFNITGGAAPKTDWASIKQQASQYCPITEAKYDKLDPSSITRSKAVKMGNECVAEMGPFMGGLARGRIDKAIDQAFPAK